MLHKTKRKEKILITSTLTTSPAVLRATKMTKKLFSLSISYWSAADYRSGANCNPTSTDLYLFSSREEAETYALSLDKDSEYVAEASLYHAELDEETILEESGFDGIEDFEEALATEYSSSPCHKNYGENKKSALAGYIAREYCDSQETIPCANYDFDAPISGGIIVEWRWDSFIGYAREIIDLRYAGRDDTEWTLAKSDYTRDHQCDLVMTGEEVDACSDLAGELTDRLVSSGDWRWTSQGHVEAMIAQFAGGSSDHKTYRYNGVPVVILDEDDADLLRDPNILDENGGESIVEATPSIMAQIDELGIDVHCTLYECYGGIYLTDDTEIICATIRNPENEQRLICAFVSKDEAAQDEAERELCVITDSDHDWTSQRRNMINQIEEDIDDEEALAGLKEEWQTICESYPGYDLIEDGSASWVSIYDDALCNL